MGPKQIKTVKNIAVGRNCSVTILRIDNQWTPYSLVTYNGSTFAGGPKQKYINLDDARAAAAREVRRLRRTRVCRRR